LNGLAVSLLRHALAQAHACGGSKCKPRIPFPKGGRSLPGLHKRSAEDKGGACAREGQSPLVGCCCCLFFGALRGVPAEGVAEEMGRFFLPAHLWRQGETSPTRSRIVWGNCAL
jgi:hypothetical protein